MTAVDSNTAPLSFVEHVGEYTSTCGYCHGEVESVSMGMWAHNLTVEAYQELLDRGWRRSGRWLYRPLLEKLACTCAPYTIRLDARRFRPTKSQRRALRKFEAYLAGAPLAAAEREPAAAAADPVPPRTPPLRAEQDAHAGASVSQLQAYKKRRHCHGEGRQGSSVDDATACIMRAADSSAAAEPCATALDAAAAAVAAALAGATEAMVREGTLPQAAYQAFRVLQPTAKQRKRLDGAVVLTSPSAFAVAAAARSAAGGSEAVAADELAAALARRVTPLLSACAACAGMVIRAQGGHLNIAETAQAASWDVAMPAGSCQAPERPAAPQQATAPLHGAAPQPKKISSSGNRRSEAGPGPSSQGMPDRAGRRLEVRWVPMPAGPETVAEEFLLFKAYQTSVHGEAPEEVKESSFVRFLVDTPLMPAEPSAQPPPHPAGAAAQRDEVHPRAYGTYHQQYWIDGRLVAVGVLDVLPGCLSSVYFFWEPSLARLSLGRVSALREIAWAAAASAARARLRWHYLGYYIERCPKMRYKAEYGPAELLCMRNMVWVPAEAALPALRCDPFAMLSQVVNMLPARDAPGAEAAAPSAEGEEAALARTLLYLASRRGSGAGGRLLRLGQLDALGVPQAALQTLQEKLTAWRALVGPAAESIVHLM